MRMGIFGVNFFAFSLNASRTCGMVLMFPPGLRPNLVIPPPSIAPARAEVEVHSGHDGTEPAAWIFLSGRRILLPPARSTRTRSAPAAAPHLVISANALVYLIGISGIRLCTGQPAHRRQCRLIRALRRPRFNPCASSSNHPPFVAPEEKSLICQMFRAWRNDRTPYISRLRLHGLFLGILMRVRAGKSPTRRPAPTSDNSIRGCQRRSKERKKR